MCLLGARRRPCPELMLSRTRTRSRTSASCITSRYHSKSERRRYGATGPGRYAGVPRPSRPGDCRVLPIRVGGWRGSSPRELNPRDLGRRAQAERRPPIARAPAHVQPHRLQPVESRDERLEQSHQQVERKVLPAVRVPRELQVVRGASKRSPTYTCSSVHRAATTRIAVTLASSVPHTLADREAPAAASESLSEAV